VSVPRSTPCRGKRASAPAGAVREPHHLASGDSILDDNEKATLRNIGHQLCSTMCRPAKKGVMRTTNRLHKQVVRRQRGGLACKVCGGMPSQQGACFPAGKSSTAAQPQKASDQDQTHGEEPTLPHSGPGGGEDDISLSTRSFLCPWLGFSFSCVLGLPLCFTDVNKNRADILAAFPY
jgi:hypothetical protein